MRPVERPNSNPRKPRLIAPPGACDTHLHVYGSSERYPLSAERNYTPHPNSTLDDYLRTHRALGLERAVIVTGSANGTDNRVTLDALRRMGGNFKGLALLESAATDAELRRLNDCGITGFRVKANGRGGLSFADSRKMAARVADLEWHVEFMSQSLAEVIDAVPFLTSLDLPYVFDHVAHAEPDGAHDCGRLAELIAILKGEERAWINLYSFYQLSKAGPPDYTDMVDVVGEIIRARPDRVIWGSNWPHAGISVPMPDDGDLLDFLLLAAPEPAHRQAILVDNPARLYGWPSM